MEPRIPHERAGHPGENGRAEGDGLYDDPLWGPEEPGMPPPPRAGRVDLAALFVLLDAVRRAVPRELEGRFTALIRELLLTMRSLIDWYLERLDRPSRGPQVEDIPID